MNDTKTINKVRQDAFIHIFDLDNEYSLLVSHHDIVTEISLLRKVPELYVTNVDRDVLVAVASSVIDNNPPIHTWVYASIDIPAGETKVNYSYDIGDMK